MKVEAERQGRKHSPDVVSIWSIGVSDHRFSPKDFALSTAQQLKFKIEIMQVQQKKGLIASRNALSLFLLRSCLGTFCSTNASKKESCESAADRTTPHSLALVC